VGLHCSYQERISGFRRFWGVLYETIKQLLARKIDYDIVLTDSVEYAALAWIISKFLRKPLLIRARGDIWAELNQKEQYGEHSLPGIRLVLGIYRQVLGHCQSVIPVSNYLADQLTKNADLKDENVFTVPISVDAARFSKIDSKIESKYSELENREVILTITNFRFPDKVGQLEEYLPVLVRLLELFPGTVLSIVGGGPYLKIFQEKTRSIISPVSERTHFWGYVKDVETLYSLSRLFVYLTGLDAFPRAILEAQAAALPIITNRVGGIPEMIQHGKTGYIVNSDSELFQTATMLLEDEKLCRRIGEQAKTFVALNYSPRVIGSRWISVLRQIASDDGDKN
jgi:glycosyltransferase involved in cell wall biosynthesis